MVLITVLFWSMAKRFNKGSEIREYYSKKSPPIKLNEDCLFAQIPRYSLLQLLTAKSFG